MIDDLIQFKNKIELILNQTEQKLPEFTFLQTIMNYVITIIHIYWQYFSLFLLSSYFY
jgi:hypothetical protein